MRHRPLLRGPTRLVRLDSAWALSIELAPDSPERREFDAYLDEHNDQPAGRLRIGQELANRGLFPEGLSHIELAARWDPYSPGILDAQGMVLSSMNRPAEAAALFVRAGQLNSDDPVSMFRAGLAYAEAGMIQEAMVSLESSLRRNPMFERGWYNFGLLKLETGDVDGALLALARAEAVEPRVADYSYAAATVLLRAGRTREALEAARRALQVDPSHPGARAVLSASP